MTPKQRKIIIKALKQGEISVAGINEILNLGIDTEELSMLTTIEISRFKLLNNRTKVKYQDDKIQLDSKLKRELLTSLLAGETVTPDLRERALNSFDFEDLSEQELDEYFSLLIKITT